MEKKRKILGGRERREESKEITCLPIIPCSIQNHPDYYTLLHTKSERLQQWIEVNSFKCTA